MDKALLWKTFPELETPRLILKKIEIQHATELLAFWGDDSVTKYTDFDSFTSLATLEEFIPRIQARFDNQNGIRWGIFLKENMTLIGTCGFNTWVIQRGNKAEIGYDLHPNYWRQGIMHEAVFEMLKYGFDIMQLHRIVADVNPNNIGSQKLLEKLNFTKEGCLREDGYWKGQYWTTLIYGLLENEFQQE